MTAMFHYELDEETPVVWQQQGWLKEKRERTHLCKREVKQGDIDRLDVLLDEIE